MTDYSITFACYNQVDYTRECVDSLVRHGVDLSRVAVVDNHSTDDTAAYLSSIPFGSRIANKTNLGCGVAWNQGALALQAEWTVVMNNDVVVTAGWLDALVDAAKRLDAQVVCPSLMEGALDYDLDAFAADASSRMKDAARIGAHHGVCMCIHRSAWEKAGFFAATPALWGYEDTLFFHQLAKAGLRSAITGASWLHHYGSITVSAMKRERGLAGKQGL